MDQVEPTEPDTHVDQAFKSSGALTHTTRLDRAREALGANPRRAAKIGIAIAIGVLAAIALLVLAFLPELRVRFGRFREGSRSEQVLDCAVPESPGACQLVIGSPADRNTYYYWTTNPAVGGTCGIVQGSSPNPWTGKSVTGELHVLRSWSTAPHPAAEFTSDGVTVQLFGGATMYTKFISTNCDVAG